MFKPAWLSWIIQIFTPLLEVRSNLVWLGPLRSPRPQVQDDWAVGSSRGRDPTAEAPADEPAGGKQDQWSSEVVIIC